MSKPSHSIIMEVLQYIETDLGYEALSRPNKPLLTNDSFHLDTKCCVQMLEDRHGKTMYGLYGLEVAEEVRKAPWNLITERWW